MTGTKSSKQSGALETTGAKLPSNLKRSKTGIYQYRKVVPTDVRHIIQKSEFKESLGTDRAQALVKHAEWEAKTIKLIHDARQHLKSGDAIDNYLKAGSPRAVLKGDSPTIYGHAASLYLLGLSADLERRRQAT